MKKLRKNSKGFTLIELIMVIVVLGILAVMAIPQYRDLAGRADAASREGVVGAVRAGIATYHANENPLPLYPPTGGLDVAGTVNGPCTAANPCFGNVLAQGGITSDWSKSGDTYTHDPTTSAFTYSPEGDPNEGRFQ